MEISYTDITIALGISEVLLAIVKRSKNRQVKSKVDKSSMLMLWLCIGGGLFLGGFFSGIIKAVLPGWIQKTGVLLIIVGFIIRWVAILQLGKMFTVDVSISREHRLKTNGLYGAVRHPSYLGLLLILLGTGLLTGNAVSLIIVFLPSLIALIYRMQVEESALLAEFGSEYLNYKNKVARVIPGIY